MKFYFKVFVLLTVIFHLIFIISFHCAYITVQRFLFSTFSCLYQILQDKDRLIKRTQMKRSVYRVLGKPDTSESEKDKETENSVSYTHRHISTRPRHSLEKMSQR